GPADGRAGRRRVPPRDVRVSRARAEAAHRLPRSGRNIQPRGGAAPVRRACRRAALRDNRRDLSRRRGRARRLCRGAGRELDRGRGRPYARSDVHDGTFDLRRDQAAGAAESAVERRRARRCLSRVLAPAITRAMLAVARAPAPGRSVRAGLEQRRGCARRRGRGRGRGDRRRSGRVDLRPHGARLAYRGRAEQFDALLGARPAERAGIGPRQDLARDVGAEPARCGACAARAVRHPRRVDDALRIAPGANRPVGVSVLRRSRRASRRSPGCGGAARARDGRPVFAPAGLVPGGAGLITMSSITSDYHDVPAIHRAPEYVRAIAPYVGGKPIEELARELRLDPASIVKLASNENPRGPGREAREAIARAAAELQRYPDGNGYALKQALARRHSHSIDEIVLGNGSNDVLAHVAQAFLRPGDETVYSRHAFIVYALATQARGARGVEVPAREYGHDLAAMRDAITPKTRIVFIANPNNPTGTWLAAEAVEAFVAAVPRDVIVVVDEAYDDYLEPVKQ